MIKKSWYAALVLGLLPGLPAPVSADDSLLPVVPEAQERFSATQGCVEPTAEMRRNHMEYILHQRDETMHKGIRTRQYSLEECIDCHVSAAPDAPRVSSKKHFCNSCHSYAAVSIDCFQCHADRPDAAADHLDTRLPGMSPPHGLSADAPDSSGLGERPGLAAGDDTNEQ